MLKLLKGAVPGKISAFLGILIAILVFLDLRLKEWAYINLSGPPRDSRILIDRFLGLTYHRNHGAAFGFLGDAGWSQWFLVVVKVVILIMILIYEFKMPKEKKYWLLRIPLALIFAGGLGNLIDRFWLGYVRDMMEFLFINFPIFNLADVYVVTGVFSFLVFELFIVKSFDEDKKVSKE